MKTCGPMQEVCPVAHQTRTPKGRCSLLLTICLSFSLAQLMAFAPPEPGLAAGVARDVSSGRPIAEAQIVAHNLGKSTTSSAVTNTDGAFTFSNLEPGRYEFAATKPGFRPALARIKVV